MREDFLYYLWRFQKVDTLNLKTTDGEFVQVVHVGTHNTHNAGPDFFNAQLIIGDQKWAGNVEIHVKSSDWFVHQHQSDANYDSVILHVVWEHDVEVFRQNNSIIPTLQLKDYVNEQALSLYEKFFENKKSRWINCENQLSDSTSFIWGNWLERLYFERLEKKALVVTELLLGSKNNWEAACFCLLAKAFGGNSNGEAFLKIAQSIPISILQKTTSALKLEAILFGQANLLNEDKESDTYYNVLQKEYNYLKHKFNLVPLVGLQVQFFKLRPPNFPTIRLSQLARLYANSTNLFSFLIHENSIENISKQFKISTSEYWETHFIFDKISKKSIKKITPSFVELVVINALIPLRFMYEKVHNKNNQEELVSLMMQVPYEKNTIVEGFKKLKIQVDNALHSQALLTLKKDYCDKNRCLQCAIGYQLFNTKVV